ncbi:DUF4199 domain-containing protein [uncultured Marixanthomonas sp.]|uniref:DUF4199 domain-containing protein n=1 Tax=uncultured Marixanthomonas sp. TaxID=757245 RepID=UPI0030DAE299|tara:strand:+ start:48473 stop:48955 length:483 start_codon:yes stop_codon:yes gene_type:complete
MKHPMISVAHGSIVGVILIGYFLVLSIFGIHTQPLWSFLNIVIIGAGIYRAIRKYKRVMGERFNYPNGFKTGFYTGVVATIIFTCFFGIYITEIDTNFVDELMKVWKFQWFANIGMVILTVVLMGLASTMVLTLSWMQLFKNSWNTKEGKRHSLFNKEKK